MVSKHLGNGDLGSPSPSEGFSKDGCTFEGWRSTTDTDRIYAPGYRMTVSGEVYVTAYYVPTGTDTLKVSYDLNGGSTTSAILSQNIESGLYAVLPEKGQSGYSGYTQTGWTANGSTYSCGEAVKVTSATTFKAQWQKDTTVSSYYSVYFDSAGGSSVPTQTVAYGATATKPTDPTRERYVFQKWCDASTGKEYSFSTTVISDVYLYATWLEHFSADIEGTKVTLTLNNGNGYSGATTVDWGNGAERSYQSDTITYDYGGTFRGTITVTTNGGINPVTSTYTVTVSGSGSGDISKTDYTVRFVDKDGNQVAYQNVKSGQSASKLDGDAFHEYKYYTDKSMETEYSFGAVTSNTTVYVEKVLSISDEMKIVLAAVAFIVLALVARYFL